MLDYFRSSSSSSPEAAIAAMANEESASIVTEKKEKIDRLTHLRHQSLLSYHTPDETRDDNTPHHPTNEGREGSSSPEGYETTDCGGRHGVSVTIVDGGDEVMNTGNSSAKMRLKNKLAKFTNVITKKGRNSNNGKNKGGGGGGGSQAPTLYSHSVPQDLQFMTPPSARSQSGFEEDICEASKTDRYSPTKDILNGVSSDVIMRNLTNQKSDVINQSSTNNNNKSGLSVILEDTVDQSLLAISFLTSKSGDSDDDGCLMARNHVELESPPSVETEVNDKEYGIMMGNENDAMSIVTESQSHEVSYKDWSKMSSGRNGKGIVSRLHSAVPKSFRSESGAHQEQHRAQTMLEGFAEHLHHRNNLSQFVHKTNEPEAEDDDEIIKPTEFEPVGAVRPMESCEGITEANDEVRSAEYECAMTRLLLCIDNDGAGCCSTLDDDMAQ